MSDKEVKLKPQKISREEKAKQKREEYDRSLKVLEAIASENQSSKPRQDSDEDYLSKKKSKKEAKKKQKIKQSMTMTKFILLVILGIVAIALIIYLIYYLVHYVSYNKYKDYLSSYDYEEGKAYTPITDSGKNVPGFDLVAESDSLKLYTDTASGYVAVYDKRNGEITYSNPLNADEDTVANGTNVNFLKSAMLVYYYDADAASSSFNTYKDSVAKNQFSVESIENGVRYTYVVGDASVENGTDEDTIHFSIPLEYRLQDDYLEVSIPSSGIKEYGEGYIYRIQLLRYMGATSYDDDGYILVPNGSGSIINFNNGKTKESVYSQYIYDIDPLAADYTTVENLTTCRLSLFGICKEKSSLLVTIEDGASECVISAGISGKFNDYNYAYPTFVYRVADNLRMFGDTTQDVYVIEPDLYDMNATVRYTFLDDEYTGYSGIANYYRARMIEEGTLTATTQTGDIPFYYDVICGVKEESHFLGVQYLHVFSMTTFSQAADISNALAGDGISNQVVNLQGWFNGGYYHDAADNIKVIGKLGGKNGLANLSETVNANGGKLYADVAFQKVSQADDMYNYQIESCRYYGAGYVANFGLVNPTTLRATSGLGYTENIYSIVSPRYLPRYVEGFSDKITKYDFDGISLRDLGNTLSSDKKRTNVIEREEALDIVLAQYDELKNTGLRMMNSDANDYVFAYSSDIINAPLSGNDYAIIDETVPFYEMLVHGYIDYSSDLLNYTNSDDLPKTVLTLIECGASPHYVFTNDESSEMKMTALNRYYTTTFDNWEEKAADTYLQINEALSPVEGHAIIKHEILESDVRKVTYDNGISIYVNYNSQDVTVDGVTVPAMGYVEKEVN